MTDHEEAALVLRAQQGDREAYGALAARYGGSLLGIAYSGVRNFTASEDIAQDALLVGFENLPALRHPGKFGGWIRTIVRNLCAQWRKHAGYRNALSRENEALRERLGYDGARDPLAVLEAQERRGQLHAALAALPSAERKALLAFYFEGQRMEVAAAGAGISTASMRKRVQHGRDRLRAALNREVDAALQEAGQQRAKRAARLLAVLGAGGAVYSRAGAGVLVPATSGLAWSMVLRAALVVAVVAIIGVTANQIHASRNAGAIEEALAPRASLQPESTALSAAPADAALATATTSQAASASAHINCSDPGMDSRWSVPQYAAHVACPRSGAASNQPPGRRQ